MNQVNRAWIAFFFTLGLMGVMFWTILQPFWFLCPAWVGVQLIAYKLLGMFKRPHL